MSPTWLGTMRTYSLGRTPTDRMDLDGRTFVIPIRTKAVIEGQGLHPDVEAECEIVDGVPEVRQLTVRAKPGGKPLQGHHLRSLDLVALAMEAFIRAGDEVIVDGPDSYEYVGPISTDPSARAAVSSEIGVDPELRKVQAIYRQHADDQPVTWVAKHLQVSERTAQRRIKAAADAGLLAPTVKGKKRSI